MSTQLDTCSALAPVQLWSAAITLSPRVTGYNAYFVGLGKEIQDKIIARESQAL